MEHQGPDEARRGIDRLTLPDEHGPSGTGAPVRRLEHEAQNGAVIRHGETVGGATPVNRALYGLLAALDPARTPA